MSDPVMARFYCHACSRMIDPIMDLEIKCPLCDGGFVEEIETPPDASDDASGLGFDRFLSLWSPLLLNVIRASRNRSGDLDRSPPRDNAISLVELVQGLAGDNDEDQQRGGGAEQQRAERASFFNPFFHSGDQVVQSGFDLLRQHLAESDLCQYGTPPARKEAIEALPTIRIEEKSSCPVCLEELEVMGEGKAMPCKHVFHGGCLVPWLEMHGSCPVCRFELPAEGSSSSGEEVGGRRWRRRRSARWSWPLSSEFSESRNGSDSDEG